MEALGVPSVVVVTDKFVPLADTIAMTVGRTDLTKIVIPHPFGAASGDVRSGRRSRRGCRVLAQPGPAGR
jgi:hypothetical protein